MKYLGQHIFDFNLRARADVFLESIASGTIASGGMLGLDSNGKVVKANVPTSHDAVTLTGTPDYITISGQEITRNQIDLANDVTGTLAAGNVATLNQNTTGSAATLTTPRGFRTNLASTSSVNFDGSSDVAPGVDGVLPVANGGTGNTSGQAATVATISGLAPDTATTAAAQPNITSLGTLTSGLNIGSASYTGDGVTVTGSDSDNTYDVFVGKRKYPRIRLIDDFASGDTEFSIWNLGDELRMGTNPGNTNNAAIVIHAGNAGLVEVQDDLQVDGEIQLGSASDTTIARSAAGKVTIEGANVQTTQIVVTHHQFFLNSSSTTADFFFPYNNLNEASSTSQYYTRTIAPYDGQIVKVLIRPSAGIGTACKLQFHKITDTTLNFGTAVEEVTNVNLNTAETSVSTAFSSATFSEGDVVNVSLIKSSSSTANIQAVIVWEYTV